MRFETILEHQVRVRSDICGRPPVWAIRCHHKQLVRIFLRHALGHLIGEGDDAIGDNRGDALRAGLGIGPFELGLAGIEGAASRAFAESPPVISGNGEPVIVGMLVEEADDALRDDPNHVGIGGAKLAHVFAVEAFGLAVALAVDKGKIFRMLDGVPGRRHEHAPGVSAVNARSTEPVSQFPLLLSLLMFWRYSNPQFSFPSVVRAPERPAWAEGAPQINRFFRPRRKCEREIFSDRHDFATLAGPEPAHTQKLLEELINSEGGTVTFLTRQDNRVVL